MDDSNLTLIAFLQFGGHWQLPANPIRKQLPLYISTKRCHSNTGGPRYMREIGTAKIGSHIRNSHVKRPRMTVN